MVAGGPRTAENGLRMNTKLRKKIFEARAALMQIGGLVSNQCRAGTAIRHFARCKESPVIMGIIMNEQTLEEAALYPSIAQAPRLKDAA